MKRYSPESDYYIFFDRVDYFVRVIQERKIIEIIGRNVIAALKGVANPIQQARPVFCPNQYYWKRLDTPCLDKGQRLEDLIEVPNPPDIPI